MARLTPERRHYSVRTMNMNEPGIAWGLFGDLYVVLGEKMGPDAYAMRLHHKPLVRWIWLGGMLMMAGGALRLLGRRPLLAAQCPSASQACNISPGQTRQPEEAQ
ncbi:Cytochrome c-type biogenesis protein CcmF [compost metagenome]